MAGLLGRAREEEHDRLLAEQQAALGEQQAALAEQQAALAALAARLDAGERERQRLGERSAALEAQLGEAKRELEGARSSASAVDERIARLERQLDGVLPLLTAALVRRMEAETDGGELPDVPTALGRLDRQLKAYMGDTDRTVRLLVERLEEMRRARG